ncbi:hypothetical protein [Sandaracinus amylolyticus]|uniref:SWIM-type domain-containing protein n=1 Tax=Sandaracinus amylolyticus TaxID=927083 RepID=A0A0F6YLA8_9BACT|nr:hypothetical protein [Sandaracinus amylolyticus]AKF09216.1 hypothetical protein DB32_006365 [Sandaracinus amylolyticus]
MNYELRYLGKSSVDQGPYRSTLRFSPNLARDRVWLDGELRDPLRFREAISALHAVVVGDLKFEKRDKSAYEAWKKAQLEEEARIRSEVRTKEQVRLAAEIASSPPSKDLESQFRTMHRVYWDARVKWANELAKNDPQLFRSLVPCDPIVTVADDVVFFECFSKDESSYGALYLDREQLDGAHQAAPGTTNVDYSLPLFDHFQGLRTYRATRLKVDPEGFEVRVEGHADYREEKIDLPPSWLRGFGQISAATGLPMRRVSLDVASVYSVLAHLKRHREKEGPRAIRFELVRGKPARLVLEPWNVAIEDRGVAYDGEKDETIKVWGRRRLFALARLLPIAERIDVHLLGNGLPSIWIVTMPGMRFVLALSGWTSNDWSGGTNLDLITGTFTADAATLERVGSTLRVRRTGTPASLASETGDAQKSVAAALHRLSKQGQAVYDFAAGAYRFRDVVEAREAEKVIGPEPEELTAARKLFVEHRVKIEREEALRGGKRLLVARISGESPETILDRDGVFSRARCTCTHHRRFGLRNGACRHLLALRLMVIGSADVRLAAGSIGGSFFG